MTTATEGRRIHILPDYLANQIAAGEVVERPASVVKELVENALDAGATTIEVTVDGGGLKLIRVADDGCGMSSEDAVAAFERHATSKISSSEDLGRVTTLGFRGEALPSIASVSRCTLTTSSVEALGGTRVELEGGSLKGAKPEGCPSGTVVEVRDLFYNTPARRKFLRSQAYEVNQIIHAVASLALAHESVAFRLVSGDRSVLSVPSVASLAERVAGLLGGDMAGALLAVEGEVDGIGLDGLASPPSVMRSSRDHQYLILGGRPFRDRRLSFSISQAYEGLLPPGRHPLVFLRFYVDPARVDVNVHPSKQEVRFERPGDVFDLVRRSLRAAVEGLRPRPAAAPEASQKVSDFDRRQRVEQAIETFLSRARPAEDVGLAEMRVQTKAPSPGLEASRPQQGLPSLIEGARYLGQIYRSYLCFEVDTGLVLIDQHVAHERVLYEKLARETDDRRVATQELLVPLTLEVSPAELSALEERTSYLEEMGLGVEPFGGRTVVVKRVPAVWDGGAAEEKVRSVLEALLELDDKASEENIRHKVLAAASCQAALKAGRPMAEAEALSLIKALTACRSPLVCPHGRPVVLVVERSEMERKFQFK